MKVSYKIVSNHKNVPKKKFSDVFVDDEMGLCSIATGYKILINQSKCSKKDFSDVSLDNKTGLCSIATGNTNDNIVRILRELHKLIICTIGPC